MPISPIKLATEHGNNDPRFAQVQILVMDFNLSINRLQGSQLEFLKEQAQTTNR